MLFDSGENRQTLEIAAMNLFSWLLVGHLVGDWVFQSDWMAQGKRQGLVTPAGMVHFVVYTAVTNHPALQFYKKSGLSPLYTTLLGDLESEEE